MDRLQALRERLGFPLVVSSGYRTPAYNKQVSDSGEDGPHTTGHAVDLIANGPRAYAIVGAAIALGFTGIGVCQKGDVRARFVHLDDLPMSATLPRPWIWSYNRIEGPLMQVARNGLGGTNGTGIGKVTS